MDMYELGPFLLDTPKGVLLHGSEPVALGQRAVALLGALIERPGALVLKDALIAAAWRGQAVDDANLAVQIAALRRVLGTAPGGDRWIETMPRRGYRFVGPVVARNENAVTAAPPQVDASRGGAPIWHDAAERRQVTALSCELVGSGADAGGIGLEDLRDAIGDFRRCASKTAARHAGVIYRQLGNNLLVLFGYPEAHEHDAERAIRAGLELCAVMPCRVGIATGMVIVGESVGDGAAPDREIVGDVPNLANRLLTSAEQNTVVIDRVTRRLIGNLFRCRDLGTLDTNGDTEPTRRWQVLQESTVPSRFDALRGPQLTRLVGRDEEIDLLLRRWERAKAGDSQIILISGEAGIGKSRITVAFEERLKDEPYFRLRYFCSPHHQDSALFPVIDQLGRAAGFTRKDPSESKWEKLEVLLARAAPPDEDVAFLAHLMSLPPSERHPLPNLSPQRKKARTLEALIRQLEGLAYELPLVMVLEDAHWLDPTSRELLDLTVKRVRKLPVLLIVTFRPEFQPPWTGEPQVSMVALNRLDRRDCTTLIAEITGSKALPDDVVSQIAERSDGVPLFVEELAKVMIESGLLTDQSDHDGVVGRLRSLAIPATLHGSLLARLDHLALVREVAQVAAALGRQFSHELISAIAAMPRLQLEAGLTQLVDAELAYRRGVPPDAEYTFKHALVQDAAYQSMLKSRRAYLHARIADVMENSFSDLTEAEPETLARHLTAAALAQRAIPYWLAAGRRAYERWALREAIVQLNAGIGLLTEVQDETVRMELELDLQYALGLACRAAKGWMAPEVEGAFSRAHELCLRTGKTAELPQVVRGIANVHWARGNPSAGKILISQLLESGDIESDDDQLMVTHGLMGCLLEQLGERSEAEVHFAIADRLCNPKRQLSATFWLGTDFVSTYRCHHAFNLASLGHVDAAVAVARDAVALARRTGDSLRITLVLIHAAMCLVGLNDPVSADSFAEEGMARARDHGFVALESKARSILGWTSALQTGAREGASDIRESIASARSSGEDLILWFLYLMLSEAELATGDPNAAAEAANQGLHWCERIPQKKGHIGHLHYNHGDAMVRLGDRAQAEADYHRALAWSHEHDEKWDELNAALRLARLWQAENRATDARDLLAPVYGWFIEGFDNSVLQDARALLEELAVTLDCVERVTEPTRHPKVYDRLVDRG